MPNIPEYNEIFGLALDELEMSELGRREIIDKIIFALTEGADKISPEERFSLRSKIGVVLSDMEKKAMIATTRDGTLKKREDKIIAIRIEKCEEQILKLVQEAPKTKAELRDALVYYFGTDTTVTDRDDNRLFTYIGQILKRLVNDGIFDLKDGKYVCAEEKSAYIKNRTEVLALKAAYLSRLHSKGGEFFEYYFINLLTRYFTRMGKTVIDAHVTGGSDDGGIDGIVKTVDSLGFREIIMVQTKNRADLSSETDVRSFYGAVCAQQGSRGIFATSSGFHPTASRLLDSIDNCVGVDGDKLFSMACDISYGIRRNGEKLIIDSEIL